MRCRITLVSGLFLTVLLQGCGGGGSSVPSSAQNAVRSGYATVVHVDMATRNITYTAQGLLQPNGSSKAVFGTAAATITGPTTLIMDNGDPQIATIAITITNNLGVPYGAVIGQSPTNASIVPASASVGVRAVLTGFTNILPVQQPTPLISISNPDGFVPDVVTNSGSATTSPAPFIMYPPIPAAGVASQTGVVSPNPTGNNKQTKSWSFVIPKGVASFNFTIVVEGPVSTEAPPETEASTASATVRTFAGAMGVGGFVDGLGTVARCTALRQSAIDSAGNLYVIDDHSVRRITPSGTMNTIVNPSDTMSGAAPPTNSIAPSPVSFATLTGDQISLQNPSGIAVDPAGATIYVTDAANTANTIVRFSLTPSADPTKAGSWTGSTIAGNGSAGTPGVPVSSPTTGTKAQFNSPQGIAIDAVGNLYIADTGANRIWRMSFNGAANFGTPATVSGATLTTNWTLTLVAGSLTGTSGSQDGQGSSATFSAPTGITVSPSGIVFVCDAGSNIIRQITVDGNVTTIAGNATAPAGHADNVSATSATFSSPSAITCDPAGYLYIADTQNHTIRRLAPVNVAIPKPQQTYWAASTVAGAGNKTGSMDGTAKAALFNMPLGIAVDSTGNLYVNDTGNDAIRIIQRVLPGS